MNEKLYLGDSVYVSYENNMIKLVTNNGLGDSDPIYLEDYVLDALFAYCIKNRILFQESGNV